MPVTKFWVKVMALLTYEEFTRIVQRVGYVTITVEWQPTETTIDFYEVKVYTYEDYVRRSIQG